MKRRTSESDMLIGKLTQINDFLPPPSQLAQSESSVKVTIVLKKSSIDFFKHAAHKHHTKYQKMIREVLDRYASQYKAA